jgi:D-serine deaminase-like pyridoxal phosphate-dependent protein
MALNEVDTPALLLDLDAFDSNLQRLDARRLDCDKWHTERSVCAVRKSPKLKQWSQAGFPM